jgi:sterol desaturase/sphingolipid hydroxylase (fatty acid hydroxylase superfamily)
VQHVLLHKVPLLWRIHRLHHSDPDFDFTTQLRFHPFEAAFSTGCFALFVVAVGLPPAGVFLHSLLVAMIGFLQHGNVRCWRPLESTLRRFIVTSDLHRIHHSADVIESNSNYGSLLPLWDRIFGTYVDQPAGGHQKMRLGLIEYKGEESQKLRWLLLDPFISRRHPDPPPTHSRTEIGR